MKTTSQQYNAWQQAYGVFNRKLFGGALPDCLITLQRDKVAYGYFWASKFGDRTKQRSVDEISMNPDGFLGRTDEQILSTLAHEMAHVWQQHFGTPSRKGYHNTEWAEKMLEIGLIPTATGIAGGKMTGQKMTHVIVEGGAYQKAYQRLVSQRGFKLVWESRSTLKDTAAKKKTASKTKFVCPCCDAAVWGKPGSLVICGICYDDHLTASIDSGEALEVPFMIAVLESED